MAFRSFRRRWTLQPMEIVRIILMVDLQDAIITDVMTTSPELAHAKAKLSSATTAAERTEWQIKVNELVIQHQQSIDQAKDQARNQVIQAYPLMSDLTTWDAIKQKVSQWERDGGRYGRVRTPWVRIGALLNAVMPAGMFFALGMGATNLVYSLWITPGKFAAPLWITALVGLACVAISALIIGLVTAKARATKAEKDAGLLQNADALEHTKSGMEQLDPIKADLSAAAKKTPTNAVSLFQDNSSPTDGTWIGPPLDRKFFLTPRDIAKIRIKIQQLSQRYQEEYTDDGASGLAASLLRELCVHHPEMQGLSWQEIGLMNGDWSIDHASHGYVRNFQHYLGLILKVLFTVASNFTLGYLVTELTYTFATLGFEVTSIMSAPFWVGAIGGVGLMLILGTIALAYCLADIDTQTSLDVKLVEMQENVGTVSYYAGVLVKDQKCKNAQTESKGQLNAQGIGIDIHVDDADGTLESLDDLGALTAYNGPGPLRVAPTPIPTLVPTPITPSAQPPTQPTHAADTAVLGATS